MAELRVLVTGGAGFIGAHLARRLAREGAEVTLLDDFSRGRRDHDLKELESDAAVTVVRHDLTTPIPPELLPGPFHHVYHLAAVVGVARTCAAPGRVLEVNLRAVLHLLDWCAQHPPEVVFLSSTSEVTDGAVSLGLAGLPAAESAPFALADPSAPRSAYALSKMAAEMLLRTCHHDRFRVRIGRYHNIYGPRMGHDHVVAQFIQRALDRADPFAVYGATQSRAFCYVDDAVEATVALTRVPAPAVLVANIGDDTAPIRIDELARQVVRLAGYQPRLHVFDPPPLSPARRLPDLAVLREHTGYRPSVDLPTGLARTFDWYARAGSPP